MRSARVRAVTGRYFLSVVGAVVAAGLLAGCGGGHKTTSNADSQSTASSAKSTASYATLVGAGSKLLGQGNGDAAEQLFKQAITKDDTQPAAYYDLGVVYQRAGDRINALRQYRLALSRDHTYVPALYNEAVMLAPVNVPLAMFYYRQVIHFKPDSPTAYLNLGLLEEKQKSKTARERGLLDLKQAMHLDPSLKSSVPAPLRARAERFVPPKQPK